MRGAQLGDVGHRRHVRRRHVIRRQRCLLEPRHAAQQLGGEDKGLVRLEEADAQPKGPLAASRRRRGAAEQREGLVEHLPVGKGVLWMARRVDRAADARIEDAEQHLRLLGAGALAVIRVRRDALGLAPALRVERREVGHLVVHLARRGDIVAMLAKVLRQRDPIARAAMHTAVNTRRSNARASGRAGGRSESSRGSARRGRSARAPRERWSRSQQTRAPTA